jgi:hypothetical protein
LTKGEVSSSTIFTVCSGQSIGTGVVPTIPLHGPPAAVTVTPTRTRCVWAGPSCGPKSAARADEIAAKWRHNTSGIALPFGIESLEKHNPVANQNDCASNQFDATPAVVTDLAALYFSLGRAFCSSLKIEKLSNLGPLNR